MGWAFFNHKRTKEYEYVNQIFNHIGKIELLI
jgi:hypothetical protein